MTVPLELMLMSRVDTARGPGAKSAMEPTMTSSVRAIAVRVLKEGHLKGSRSAGVYHPKYAPVHRLFYVLVPSTGSILDFPDRPKW